MKDSPQKIAVLLCKCGTNISQNIDLTGLGDWAKKQPNVVTVVTHDLLCSPAGKQCVVDTIEKSGADSVLIAACSPKMHEQTFREEAEKKNLNLARVHMANIREHAAWVTPDPKDALDKAKSLVNAAIKRVLTHVDLEKRSMTCSTDIVVIGGGIAGIEAALMAAEAGRTVTIIEKEISLGGTVIKTDEVAPSMECAPCMLAPRLSAVRENKNITVITNAEVRDVLGFFGNFTIKVLRKARYVTDACIGCEACFETCPVSVPSSFHLGLGNRKAIYTEFPGSVPAAAAIDETACLRLQGKPCDECVKACGFNAVNFNDKPENIQVKAGAVIIAIGHNTPKTEALLRFPLGERVITMDEFERLAASNGPTGGEVRTSKGVPASIAVVHCAGSLSSGGLDYCSGICCMNSMKAGELFRKKNPGGKVTHIHDRLVFPFPAAESFYHRQREEGATFIKTASLSALSIEEKNGTMTVTGKDFPQITADLIVLSHGMGPAKDTRELGSIASLETDSHGYYKPDHPLLRAMATGLSGIYMAGSCVSPCSISEAVMRARAAAGDAMSMLVEGKNIELESMTSYIDGQLCAGCKLCIAVCPYKAISYDNEKKISVINEAICRGCGTCAAACGANAAHARHYTNKQIYAEIEGVLHE